MNKVIARYLTGRMVKGTTADFLPAKERFHLSAAGELANAKPLEVLVSDLKALFFVKDYSGDSKHVEGNSFDPAHPPAGRKVKVTFKDGEVLVGTTQGYQPGRQGFFLVPADLSSNIERCYVVSAAASEIGFL
jgi:hypothetical protein